MNSLLIDEWSTDAGSQRFSKKFVIVYIELNLKLIEVETSQVHSQKQNTHTSTSVRATAERLPRMTMQLEKSVHTISANSAAASWKAAEEDSSEFLNQVPSHLAGERTLLNGISNFNSRDNTNTIPRCGRGDGFTMERASRERDGNLWLAKCAASFDEQTNEKATFKKKKIMKKISRNEQSTHGNALNGLLKA